MKKTALISAAVLLAASCGLEAPESVTVTGRPRLHIPIGSLSSIKGGKANIPKYAGIGEIAAMAGEGNEGAEVYAYPAARGGALAYLIRYPILDMSLDLAGYVRETAALPEIPLINPGPDYREAGPVPASLEGMARLVREIAGTGSGLRVKAPAGAAAAEAAEKLQVKIPALGIPEYIYGARDGDSLLFAGGDFVLDPQAGPVLVYLNVPGGADAGIAAELVLNWTAATVDAGIAPVQRSIRLSLNSLMSALGPGVSLKSARGYVYANAGGSVSLRLGDADLLGGFQPLEARPGPEFGGGAFEGSLPPQSLPEPVDLAGGFAAGAKTLDCTVALQEMRVEKASAEGGSRISASLVVELPLEFLVSGPALARPEGLFVQLDVGGGVLPGNTGEDIFGRTGGSGSFFGEIENLAITLEDIKNTIFPGAHMRFYCPIPGAAEALDLLCRIEDGTSVSVPVAEAPAPFNPAFQFLLPAVPDEGTPGRGVGEFRFPKDAPPELDFLLALEADAGIEQSFDF